MAFTKYVFCKEKTSEVKKTHNFIRSPLLTKLITAGGTDFKTRKTTSFEKKSKEN